MTFVRTKTIWWLTLAAVLLLISARHSSAAPVDYVSATAYVEDVTGLKTFEEVQRLAPQPYQGLLAKGFTTSVYWVKVTLAPSPADTPLVIRIRPQFVDSIAGYDPADPVAVRQEAGDKSTLPDTAYRSLNHNIWLSPSGNRSTYWLRVQTTSTLLLSVSAYTPAGLLEVDRRQTLALTLYLGVLITITVLSAVLFLSKREGITAAFLAFQISSLAFSLGEFGYLRLLLSNVVAPVRIDCLTNHIILLMIATGTLFYYSLLRKNGVPWWALPVPLAQVFVFPLEIVLFNTGFITETLQLKNVMIFAITLNLFAAAFLASAAPATNNLGHTKRSVLVVFFGFLFFDLLLTTLPTMGLLSAIDFTFYNSAFVGLFSGCFMFVILYRRYTAIERFQIEGTHRLQLFETQLEHGNMHRLEQERLLGMLSHELKIPLAIMGMCIDQKAGPETTRDMKSAVRDMRMVLDRALQAIKLEEQRIVPRHETVLLESVVQRVIASLNCADSVDFHPSVSQVVETDAEILKIITSNLLENALKYHKPGTKIEVTLCIDEPGTGHELIVANIPGKAGWPDQAQLFTKFYRSPQATHQTGSGLGLYLVAGLAKTLSGSLRYEPSDTHVRFVLCLPG